MDRDFSACHRAPAAAFVALVILALGACASLGTIERAPRVSVAGIRPVTMTLLEQRYLVTLRVQNPNDREIVVKGFNYEITVNGELFGEGVSNTRIELPAYGEALTEVELTSSLARLLRQFQALIERRTPSLDLAIDGGLSVQGVPGSIPFHYENQLVLPEAGGGDDRPPTLSIQVCDEPLHVDLATPGIAYSPSLSLPLVTRRRERER